MALLSGSSPQPLRRSSTCALIERPGSAIDRHYACCETTDEINSPSD